MLQVQKLFFINEQLLLTSINLIILLIFISAQSQIQDIYLETKTLSLAQITGNLHFRSYTNQAGHRFSLLELGIIRVKNPVIIYTTKLKLN